MDQPDLLQSPDEATLLAWDWQAELRRQERSIPWLARRTGRSDRTVYRYAWGHLPTPAHWLRSAARALNVLSES